MSSVLRHAAMVVALACVATPVLASGSAPLSPRVPAVTETCVDCVPGEILVQFRAGTSAIEKSSALGAAGGTQLQSLRAPGLAKSLFEPELVRARSAGNVRDAVARLNDDPAVAFAEPVVRVHAAAVANDTYYASGAQWSMYSGDAPSALGPAGTTNLYGSQAEVAWGRGYIGRGDVYVGILDEGVASMHPDIDGNCWRNAWEYADGADNDGNGYTDDFYGWDFVNRNATVYDGGTTGTVDRHGTFVAGIIGGEGGNLAGVAGVAWRVGMIPLKVMSNGTGTSADVIAALDYLCDLKSRHYMNIVAVNCSFTTTAYSQALNDAVLRAARAGILIVAAAGNSGLNADATAVYPGAFDTRIATSTAAAATYDAVLCVGALDRFGAMASWSNWGASRVDLAAPGVEIVSTLPPSTYGSLSGTSFAAAHVSGAIALYASGNPGKTASELRAVFISSAAPTASLAGRCATGGRLDMGTALQAAVVHDGAVLSVTGPSSTPQSRTNTVSVGVQNQGTVTETLTVALVDSPPAGGTAGTVSPAQSVTLAAGASATLSFTWSTSTASTGTHVLTASLRSLAGDTDAADNVRSGYSTVTAILTPVVSAVSPAAMRGGTRVTVTLTGSGYAQGALVTFAGGTGPQPSATSIVIGPGGASLTCAVSAGLATAAGVPWDVVVTNPDGRSGRKLAAFAVTP